jgi:hypothetical protein
VRILENRFQSGGAVDPLKREDPDHRLAGELHEGRWVALAFAEGGTRLGVEAEYAFAPDCLGFVRQPLGGLDQAHLALVAPDRQVRQLFARNRRLQFRK